MTHTGTQDAKSRVSPNLVCIIAYGLAFAVAAVTVAMAPAWHPLWVTLVADVAATLIVVAVGMAVRNASVYDPYWSVAPPIILAYWIWLSGLETVSLREGLVFLLVLAWGVRLTVNCMRRWRDLSEEDFRYRDLRAGSGIWFPFVNLFGIALFPTLLVFAGCLPLYPVTLSSTPLGLLDGLAFAVTAGAIFLESVADEQLVRFKKTNPETGQICTSGVWGLSQHPNYLGELLFWWGLWLFAVAAEPDWWWTVVGPLAMSALFHFISIPMMLTRKRQRYTDYDEQVKDIPVLIPRSIRRT